MCDAATQTVIQELVQDKIGQRRLFSAWDITQEIRKNGINERHSNVKRIVHAMFEAGEMSGYSRRTVSLPGVRIPPFVYHPAGTNADDYLKNGDPTNVATVSTEEEEEEDSHLRFKKPGLMRYLYIPTAFVACLGMIPGDSADIIRDGNTIRVSKSGLYVVVPGCNVVTRYSVDAKGNIRIPEKLLPTKSGNFRIELKYYQGKAREILIS